MPQTVPNRPMNGRSRSRGGQKRQADLKLAHVDGESRPHRPLDPLPPLGAALGGVLIAPGLVARGNDPARGSAHLRMKLLARARGGFEGARLAADAADAQELLEDDGPAAEGGQHQQDHDAFDDRVGLQEEAEKRHVVRCCGNDLVHQGNLTLQRK